uniref:Transcription regulator [contains diacylglycerol kinase catalytic domain] n=1 Tax=Loigolactobacillus rennini TaxID=238013 RepID=A0A1K2I4M0_9LACO|nr:Transcription regulator [contains diacylglycerol kinase catalytic domain] [Loigolactobacillus rennini]
MQQRARVIYNPVSGHESLKPNMIDILGIFEQAGYETSAYATTAEPLSAQNEATRAAKAGFDLVVAAGGDGTINQVVNGLAGLKKRPKMAIIPAGTTNDYARALKIPRDDPVAAAKVVLKRRTIKMDIGQADDKYFMNIAGGGFLTELTYGVPSETKSIFGYLAYLVEGAKMLPQIKPVPMHLIYDDGEFNGEASMFLLGLTNSIGGFEKVAPDVTLGDGRFSLIIVKTSNLAELIRLIALALNGKHLNDKRIIYTKTHQLIAKTENGTKMKINLDGEYGGTAPMTFTNLKQHIEIYADVAALPKSATAAERTAGLPQTPAKPKVTD